MNNASEAPRPLISILYQRRVDLVTCRINYLYTPLRRPSAQPSIPSSSSLPPLQFYFYFSMHLTAPIVREYLETLPPFTLAQFASGFARERKSVFKLYSVGAIIRPGLHLWGKIISPDAALYTVYCILYTVYCMAGLWEICHLHIFH